MVILNNIIEESNMKLLQIYIKLEKTIDMSCILFFANLLTNHAL